jgi:radical SAM protein with 4Fe4S-binding SPASM domain
MEPNHDSNLSTGKVQLIARIGDAGLHPPETLTLMVTDGCNLSCRHCWLDCRPHERAVPVAAEAIMRAIDAFAGLGGTRVNLTGGEVLTHPEWCRILRFCCDHDTIVRVGLQTNATLITDRHIEALLHLRLDKLMIQVSLDGAHARTHNLVRGPGSYAYTMAGLRSLVNAGLGRQTQVNFTEMAHNFIELPEVLEMVDKMGLGRLISSTLVKDGRAAASSHISLPTPAQYWELIHLYETDAFFRKLYDLKATVAAIEWYKNRSESNEGGCSCLKNLFADAQGRLYPCTMLLLDRYASESIYRRPLDQVIGKALSQWREIPLLSRQRANQVQLCVRCPDKQHCAGGCMGRAATTRGELMDPEDRCALRKAVYHWIQLPSVGSFCRNGHSH